MSKASQQRKTFSDKLSYFFKWIYLNYSLHMNTYMMEPVERKIFNAIVLTSVITACYTTYVFLPAHCEMILSYLMGSSGKTPEALETPTT